MDLTRYIKIQFPKKFNRPSLSEEQMFFLQGIIPFGLILQGQVHIKTKGRLVSNSILPSVLIADLAARSDWGRLKPASEWNNLGLLRKDTVPKIKHKTKRFNLSGKEEEAFRVYDTWYDFTVDMSDHIAFSGYYDKLLLAKNSDDQLQELELIYKLQNIPIYDNIYRIVADYGLTELDVFSSVA